MEITVSSPKSKIMTFSDRNGVAIPISSQELDFCGKILRTLAGGETVFEVDYASILMATNALDLARGSAHRTAIEREDAYGDKRSKALLRESYEMQVIETKNVFRRYIEEMQRIASLNGKNLSPEMLGTEEEYVGLVKARTLSDF